MNKLESIGSFFRQGIFSYKALFGWLDPKVYILTKIVSPIFQLIFFCSLARFAYGKADVTQWVIGNSILMCYLNTVFGLGGIMAEERNFGTLKLIIATPYNKFVSFIGRSLMHITDGISTVLICIAAGIIVFGADFSKVNVALFAADILIAVFAASGLGMLIGCCGLVIRDMNLLMNTAATTLLALCGTNFPVERLPLFLQKISYCLPLTRSIQAAWMIAEGNRFGAVSQLMLQEALLGILYMLAGYCTLAIMEYLSRKKATLDIF